MTKRPDTRAGLLGEPPSIDNNSLAKSASPKKSFALALVEDARAKFPDSRKGMRTRHVPTTQD